MRQAALFLTLSIAAAPVMAQSSAAQQSSDATAIVASLKSQLRNLVSAQESYYADRSTYTNSLKALGYKAAEGAVIMVFRADNRGWAGRAVHPGFTGKSCVIWVGRDELATQVKTDAEQTSGQEGAPTCDAP